MTVLESAFEQVSDDIEAGRVKQFEYDIKVDIPLEDGVETVHGKPLLTRTLETLKNVARAEEVIEFYDIDNVQILPNLSGMKNNEIGKRFCVEITKGRKKTMMFGFKLKSTIPFVAIKDRTVDKFRQLNTYIRIHYGGFEHGVNWVNLGFLLDQHPTFSNKRDIKMDIFDKVNDAWIKDADYWTATKKHEIKMLVNPNCTIFRPNFTPMETAPVTIASKLGDETVRITVLMITTPQKYVQPMTQIMDYLLLQSKSVKGYIPIAYKHENPEAFHDILAQHSQWMDDHRNIQVQFHDAYRASVQPGKDGQFLMEFLKSRDDIIAVHADHQNNRYNISVDQKQFREVQQQIHDDIRSQAFPFKVTVKMPTKTTDNSSITTNTTKKMRYQEALESISITASNKRSSDTATISSNRSSKTPNPWKRRTDIPVVIDFSNDDEQFPSLPTTRRPSSPSQASEHSANTLTITTIQTAVADALKMAREEHNKEMMTLRNEIKSLQDTFQLMMQTIATQSETINKHIISLQPSHQEKDTSISPPRKRRPPQTDKTPTKSNKQPPAPSTIVHTVTEGHDTKMDSQDSDDEDDPPLGRWDDSDSDTDVPSTQADAQASDGRED